MTIVLPDLNFIQKHWKDGFYDGFNARKANKVCQWIDHKDVFDGCKHPNTIYAFAYECGYEIARFEDDVDEEKFEDFFLKFVKCYLVKVN